MMQIILKPTPGDKLAQVRWEKGVLSCNGKTIPLAEEITIEYGEERGCTTLSDDPAQGFEIIPSTWVDPAPPAPEPEPQINPLDSERLGMIATLAQLSQALGEVRWKTLMAYADGPENIWDVAVIVSTFSVVARVSRTADVIAHVADLTPEEMDDVFRKAAEIGKSETEVFVPSEAAQGPVYSDGTTWKVG